MFAEYLKVFFKFIFKIIKFPWKVELEQSLDNNLFIMFVVVGDKANKWFIRKLSSPAINYF